MEGASRARCAEAACDRGNIEVIGTPEQVVDQFLQLKKAGIDGLQLSFFDFKPDLDSFGRRVLPLMEQAGLRISPSRMT